MAKDRKDKKIVVLLSDAEEEAFVEILEASKPLRRTDLVRRALEHYYPQAFKMASGGLPPCPEVVKRDRK